MLLRYIYPLALREKIFWKIKRFFPNIKDKNISLSLDKKIKLDLSKYDIGHQSIIFNGFYELNLTKSILRLGKKGGLMIDVGANYGYFSCLWADQNKINKVIAFEASPNNYQPLINNIEKNKLRDKITVVPYALGKEIGQLQFNLENETKQTGWGGISINNNPNSINVHVETLDYYAEKNNIIQIEVLKIDTEGADTWVLYGAEKLIKEKKIHHIFFEINSDRMKNLNIGENDAYLFLKRHGYKVTHLDDADMYAYPSIS